MGKLFDDRGNRISPSHALKDGRRYRYYVSRTLVTGPANDTDHGWRLPAPQIEQIVAVEAAKMLGDCGALATATEQAGVPASRLPAVIASAGEFRGRLLSDTDRADSLTNLIQRVELGTDLIRVTLDLTPLVAAVDGGVAAAASEELILTREAPLRIKRRGVEMRIVIEGERPPTPKSDPTLIKEIKRAHRCFDALLAGRASIAELAKREGVDDRYVSTVLPLAFLSPDIVEAIVAGTQPHDLTATKLVRGIDLALAWADQKRQLGFG
jgi:hypothetical protein